MRVSQCIWCKQTGNPASVEHIIPEALGCPNELILERGEVCRACNTKLAFLDRAIVDEFDLVGFNSGVPRKKFRPPRIDSRGNMVGYHTDQGPVFAINMERYPVTTPDGERVAAVGGSARNIRAKLEKVGDTAQVSFNVPFGQSPLFVRGIHKIALGSVAYFLGAAAALQPSLDPVRSYVIHRSGRRRVIALPVGDTSYKHVVRPPVKHATGDWTILFRLAMLEFLVDLSPEQRVLPKLVEELHQTHGEQRWTLLPTPPQDSIR